ncbi:MAG: hypothetical protein WAN65_01765, partial [Candidatus Sulfotelmatobacter sp.]
MTAIPYLVQLSDPDSAPARVLRNGADTMIVMAANAADAEAMAAVANPDCPSLFSALTAVALSTLEATDMHNWNFRLRIIAGASDSHPGSTLFDGTVSCQSIAATGVLTSTQDYANNETVTIGSHVYTFKTTLTGAADEVLRGVSEANTMANLVAAINGAAGAGTAYGTGTVKNTDVTATTDGVHAVTVTAITPGSAGNSIASTETAVHASWGGTTLAGGDDALINALAEEMVAPLVAAGFTASFNAGTHVLTASTSGDNHGDATLIYSIYPPDSTDQTLPTVGVATERLSIAGFVASKVDDGVEAAALTITFQADTYA